MRWVIAMLEYYNRTRPLCPTFVTIRFARMGKSVPGGRAG